VAFQRLEEVEGGGGAVAHSRVDAAVGAGRRGAETTQNAVKERLEMPLFAEEWRRFVDLVQNRTAFDNLPDPRRTAIHDNRSRASGAKIEDAECYVE